MSVPSGTGQAGGTLETEGDSRDTIFTLLNALIHTTLHITIHSVTHIKCLYFSKSITPTQTHSHSHYNTPFHSNIRTHSSIHLKTHTKKETEVSPDQQCAFSLVFIHQEEICLELQNARVEIAVRQVESVRDKSERDKSEREIERE